MRLFTPSLLSAFLGAATLVSVLPGSANASPELALSGEATRTMLFTDIYTVRVYDRDGRLSSADLSDAGAPIRIELDVLYDGDMPDIPEGWSSELKPVLPQGDWQALSRAYDGLGEGDMVVLRYTPETGSVITRNGETIVREDGFTLAAATLDIWFGDTPVDDDIKDDFLKEE